MIMRILRGIKRRLKDLRTYDIVKTLIVNFRVFPYHIAKSLPLKIGHNVEFIGLRKGCIMIDPQVPVHRYMVWIGISPYPMYSTKGLYTLVRIQQGGVIVFGDEVKVNNGVSLIIAGYGTIKIGSDVVINQLSKIYSNKEVEIGSHVRIGWECQVLDSDCHLVYNSETREIKSPMAKVTIGDNVWLCARTSIMKGADIPPYSIIAANSLVNKPFRDITPPHGGKRICRESCTACRHRTIQTA